MISVRKNRLYLHFLLLPFVLWISALPAAPVEEIFLSVQEVEDQSTQERRRAARAGLEQVLVKVSGSKKILHESEIVPLLQNPESYVASYYYLSKQVPTKIDSIEVSQSEETSGGKKSFIRFDFNEVLIKEYFTKQRLPLWSANRPRILMWWGLDSSEERSIVDQSSQFAAGFFQSAQERGLPLLLPKMDEQDAHSVQTKDVWALDFDILQIASRRYNPSVILVGKTLSATSGKWYTQWSLLLDGAVSSWTLEYNNAQDLQNQVMNQVAEVLSAEYAVIMGDDDANEGELLLAVHDITQLQDYARVSEYLEQLLSVKKIALQHVKPSILIFQLEIHGDLNQFRRALNLDHKLSAISSLDSDLVLGFNLPPSHSSVISAMDDEAGSELSGGSADVENSPTNLIEYRWLGR